MKPGSFGFSIRSPRQNSEEKMISTAMPAALLNVPLSEDERRQLSAVRCILSADIAVRRMVQAVLAAQLDEARRRTLGEHCPSAADLRWALAVAGGFSRPDAA
ncbi:hypothetical protein D6827_00125, partial [Candidatus Parcubacteria bacterium]